MEMNKRAKLQALLAALAALTLCLSFTGARADDLPEWQGPIPSLAAFERNIP